METGVAVAHEGFIEDQRETCICGKEIRWCGSKLKWFHIHNFMTFCSGMAIDANHNDQPKAEPAAKIK